MVAFFNSALAFAALAFGILLALVLIGETIAYGSPMLKPRAKAEEMSPFGIGMCVFLAMWMIYSGWMFL